MIPSWESGGKTGLFLHVSVKEDPPLYLRMCHGKEKTILLQEDSAECSFGKVLVTITFVKCLLPVIVFLRYSFYRATVSCISKETNFCISGYVLKNLNGTNNCPVV